MSLCLWLCWPPCKTLCLNWFLIGSFLLGNFLPALSLLGAGSLSCCLCSSSCCCDFKLSACTWLLFTVLVLLLLRGYFLMVLTVGSPPFVYFSGQCRHKEDVPGALLTNSTRSKWLFTSFIITHNFGVKCLGSYLWDIRAKKLSIFFSSIGYFCIFSFQSYLKRWEDQSLSASWLLAVVEELFICFNSLLEFLQLLLLSDASLQEWIKGDVLIPLKPGSGHPGSCFVLS